LAIGRANGTPPSGSEIDASQSHSSTARGDVLEHLERVQRRTGLALGGAQVGLEPPAVAAIGVAVGLQRRERAVGRRPVDDNVEAPPVEQPRVGCHEVRCRLQVHHVVIVP
jgi:hypothetical protein